MKIRILLLILLVPLIGFAQSDNLSLLDKYERSEWISYNFFNNRVNDQLIIYEYVDSILSVYPDKSISLKIKYYGNIFKKSTAKIEYDMTGTTDFKTHGGLISFPRRAVWFIGDIPYQISEFVTKTDKNISENQQTISKNDNGLIISVKTTHWLEKYDYDLNNEIVKIEREFNPYNEDSTGFRTLCVSSANKWIGKYDSNGKLINETTYWDNGKEYQSNYIFENGYLVKSEYLDIFKNSTQIKEYIYDNNVLNEVNIYNSKLKRIGRLNYKWKMK